jgi:UDP-glucose 4-epimerase
MPASDCGRLRGARCLVTGGAGFIGSHVVEGLLGAGAAFVHVVDDLSLGREDNLAGVLAGGAVELTVADAADAERLCSLCDGRPFDLALHLAVIPLPHSLVHPRENVDRNVALTTAVCEALRAGVVHRLVHFSSSEVYGTARTVPMAESHPLRPHTPYAAAKAATDLVALSYHTTFGLDVAIVRPFNTYGERQNDAAYAGLIPAVVRRVQAGEPVVIDGDGRQTRDMTHVGDTVAGAIAIAGAEGLTGRVLNIGYGTEHSVEEMVRIMLEAMGTPAHPVVRGPARPGDVRRLVADISAARRAVGYVPRIGLAEGLRRTIDWYAATAAPAATAAAGR